MRTIVIVLMMLTAGISLANAQNYITKNGHIRFYSEAPVENIEADNHQVTSILNTANGEIVFSLLMKGFHFEKALMEEHFNEKYVHSDKFPKSTFKGSLQDFNFELLSEEPVKAMAKGSLTLHGISNEVSAEAELSLKGDKIYATCVFPLTLADFDISIPGVVKDNISKVVEVTVEMVYEIYQSK